MSRISEPELLRVEALAISGTIPLREFAKAFADDAQPSKTELIVPCGEKGWMVAHDFGAIVFFNVDAQIRERALETLRSVVTGEKREPVSEEFYVRVEGSSKASVLFDRIDVPELTRPIVELVALVIGQSVALEYYEEDVDRILAEIDHFSTELEARGKFLANAKELLQFVGRANVLRNRAVSTLALLDSPLLVWNDETLDRLHRHLRTTFAIRDRFDALEHKLGVIRDSLDLFVELARDRKTFWLEMSVILLIAFEIVLAMFRK